MAQCLFCGREEAQLTDEHIFPAALGGRLKLRAVTCAACANAFSREFEQAISQQLAWFRLLFKIPDRYGNRPAVDAEADVGGRKREARVLPNGRVQLKPTVKIARNPDGSKDITHQNVTERQKAELRRQAQEQGWTLIEGELQTDTATVAVGGYLDFIGSREALRSAAKIAYTTLALRLGRNFADRDIFDALRRYICTGEGESPSRLFLNEHFLAACQQGPHQHSVMFVGQRQTRRVDAIVRLLGHLCYFANLADACEGADFACTLAYNAQDGEETPVLVSNYETEFLAVEDVLSGQTQWNDIERSGTAFIAFIEESLRSRKKV